jgi:hypothetical protein
MTSTGLVTKDSLHVFADHRSESYGHNQVQTRAELLPTATTVIDNATEQHGERCRTHTPDAPSELCSPAPFLRRPTAAAGSVGYTRAAPGNRRVGRRRRKAALLSIVSRAPRHRVCPALRPAHASNGWPNCGYGGHTSRPLRRRLPTSPVPLARRAEVGSTARLSWLLATSTKDSATRRPPVMRQAASPGWRCRDG